MKKVLSLCTVVLFLITGSSYAQSDSLKIKPKKLKGNFYISWGYTRAGYSRSNIHFEDHSGKYHPATGKYQYYDFTIYDAKASDRPDFDAIKDVINITVPQFIGRIGYYFNDKNDLGIELSYDHAKYVVNDYQTLRVKGEIDHVAVDQNMVMDPRTFLHFEHTDGANFLMLNLLKRWKLYNPGPRFNVGWVAKAGGGVVIPRTDVTIFGERLNNNWKIAGWIGGVETGIRAEFLRHGVFEFTTKGSYADYRRVLVLGQGNGIAFHHFFVYQFNMTLGLMF